MDFTKVFNLLRVFPKYTWYQQAALIGAVPFGVYVVYLITVGQPPLIDYKLDISPSHWLTANGDLTERGEMRVTLDLVNLSTPSSELHNIDGEFWTNGHYVVSSDKRPSTKRDGWVRYKIEISRIPKASSQYLISWFFRPPLATEKIPIGYRAVSSETDWQEGLWFIENHDGKLRIVVSR